MSTKSTRGFEKLWHTKSTRRALRELLLPRSTIHKVLHKRLRLCAYKVQIVQQLKPGDGMERQHFAEEMLDHIDLDVDFLEKNRVHRRGNISCLR
jgi:hypothetical protein